MVLRITDKLIAVYPFKVYGYTAANVQTDTLVFMETASVNFWLYGELGLRDLYFFPRTEWAKKVARDFCGCMVHILASYL